jgi:hypothetical protein
MNPNRKQYVQRLVLVIAVPLAGLLLFMPTADAVTRKAGRAGSPYAELAAARTRGETYLALSHLSDRYRYLGPLSEGLAQKAIGFACAVKSEYEWAMVGHLAAVSGNADLLRFMVRTYFGEAEAEEKGQYVEEFLRYNPRLFFSLPDAWRLWQKVGGAQDCCNDPDKTVPVLKRYSPTSRAARLMLADVRKTVAGRAFADTRWAADVRQALAAPRRVAEPAEGRFAHPVIGPWKNLYAGDKDLAGIQVQQYPDCDWMAQRYSGRHPCMIIYVFKDGRARQLCYRPHGSVSEDFWFHLMPGHWLWETIDRSYAGPSAQSKRNSSWPHRA